MDLIALFSYRSASRTHLLLAALQLPLQHLAVIVHRGEITLQVRLVARDGIGEVRVGRPARERLRVRCGVHCGDVDGCGMEVECEEENSRNSARQEVCILRAIDAESRKTSGGDCGSDKRKTCCWCRRRKMPFLIVGRATRP